MPPLSARDRRALRRGAMVVAVAVTWSLIVRPSLARRAVLADLLEAERALLTRERVVTGEPVRGDGGPTLADSVAPARARRLFSGRDDVMVTAQLVDYVAEAARRHDVWLQSANTRPARDAGAGLRALDVELRAEGDLAGLLHLLDDLERGPALVQVASLDIRVAEAEADDGTSPLSITAVVRGYAGRASDSASVPTGVMPAGVPSTAVTLGDGGRPPVAGFTRAVERDPFSASREAPVTPYRLAAPDAGQPPMEGESPEAPMSPPTVHGTAPGAGSEAFAMCAWDGGPVLVVRPGDLIGPFTVVSIERARVIFRDGTGRRVVVDANASPDGVAP